MEEGYKTFVSVGNAKQSFLRLLNAVASQIHLLPQPILIQSGHTKFTLDQCKVVDFVNMDTFVQYVSQAQILILHAGAGSVLHSVRAAKCPIVMPRRAQFGEHVNDHQVGFASTLNSAGKAIMVDDAEQLAAAIKQLQTHQSSAVTANNQPAPGFDIIRNRVRYLLGEL